MNYLQLNPFWAIDPQAFDDVLKIVELAIIQGHAENAERAGLPISVQGKAAIVSITGPIVKHEGILTRYYGFSSSRGIQRSIQSALADEAIEDIMLLIDSPGGSVDGLAEAADAIYEARQAKPVTAQVDGSMMSAAYYLGSQATTITAGRNDLIGSIGTRTILYDYSEMFKKAGVKAIPVDTGEHKSTGAPGVPITDAQVKEVQRIVNGYFEDFKKMVMRGREIDNLDAIADGRVFFSQEAVNLGLIDGIKQTDDAITELLTKNQRSTQAAKNRIALMRRRAV